MAPVDSVSALDVGTVAQTLKTPLVAGGLLSRGIDEDNYGVAFQYDQRGRLRRMELHVHLRPLRQPHGADGERRRRPAAAVLRQLNHQPVLGLYL